MVTVDVDADTATRARRALKGSGRQVVTGDGREGHARGAPYDRIIVTASAAEVPRAWYEQLEPGGLVEVPLRLREPAGLQLIPTLRREKGILALGLGDLRRLHAPPRRRGRPLRFRAHGECHPRRRRHVHAAPGRGRRGRAHGFGPPARLDGLLRASLPLARRSAPTRSRSGSFSPCAAPPAARSSSSTGRAISAELPRTGAEAWPSCPAGRRPRKMLVYGGDEAAEELQASSSPGSSAAAPARPTSQLTASFRNGTSSIRIRWHGR